MAAIDSAASTGKILHIESHGNDEGIDDGSGNEFLSWDELTPVLQSLNEASGCNLLVFMAACAGFAGILALAQGPRAPAVALVGPAVKLSAYESVEAAKAFYRPLVGGTAHLQAMADASTWESGVLFEPEPIAILAWESWVQKMIIDARQANRQARIERSRDRLMKAGYSKSKTDALLSSFDESEAHVAQLAWDRFFMLDKHPSNASRFGVDFVEIARKIAAFYYRGF
ncbi:hypothetical protein [Noviluteimonas dokdonensis]|nr:hypothetical protein [Lysobacter dokdonensis]